MRLRKLIRFCAVAMVLIAVIPAHSQSKSTPQPGKEKLVIPLPADIRWKSQKVPKDTKAIRGFRYLASGPRSSQSVVQEILVTTIDRRYFPMKAEGSPEEKLQYEQTGCPDATLEIIDRHLADGRLAILYAIRKTKHAEALCGSTTQLVYVAEGPTAFHTAELVFPEEMYASSDFQRWCDIFRNCRIE